MVGVCAPWQMVGKLAWSGKRPRYMAGRRVAELVRMLSGLEGSSTGAAHAQELLEVAKREREGGAPRGVAAPT